MITPPLNGYQKSAFPYTSSGTTIEAQAIRAQPRDLTMDWSETLSPFHPARGTTALRSPLYQKLVEKRGSRIGF
ncbi:hypothetical protein [Moorena sp. SIO4G3]|uniref:hypothetical protein n=1 Tax=Moorena sp. SIO4G3 TaxID=2607821 RepID=UPI00142AA13C|nr:hypothetical protein [Moorena sp. SIO4G3]NEO82560.1 hypothetical protein [Moorena sp. SIO4G3]